VLAEENAEIRDASIRIFDTYLTISFSENQKVLDDTCFIAFAAAAAIVISFKLNNSRNTVDAVSVITPLLCLFLTKIYQHHLF
jgi:hypothetical protein